MWCSSPCPCWLAPVGAEFGVDNCDNVESWTKGLAAKPPAVSGMDLTEVEFFLWNLGFLPMKLRDLSTFFCPKDLMFLPKLKVEDFDDDPPEFLVDCSFDLCPLSTELCSDWWLDRAP